MGTMRSTRPAWYLALGLVAAGIFLVRLAQLVAGDEARQLARLDLAPPDDEPLTKEEIRDLQAARKRGKTVPFEDAAHAER